MGATASLNQAAPRRGKQNLNRRPRFCPCYFWATHKAIDFTGAGEGFEPPTFGLQNRCTTTVLTRRTFVILRT